MTTTIQLNVVVPQSNFYLKKSIYYDEKLTARLQNYSIDKEVRSVSP